MEKLYFFCAAFGSLFVVAQFFLTLFAGVGAEDAGDAAGDMGDVSGAGGVDSDFSGGDAGSDVDGGGLDGGDADGAAGHGAESAGATPADPSQNGTVGEAGSGVLFLKLLSIRTVTAGIAFFGLAGMAGFEAKLHQGLTFAIAVACGLTALVLVYLLYKFISSFRDNGAVTSASLPGAQGSVYIRIPPRRSGSGKVIVNQQDRSMEYEAFTDSEVPLVSGTPVTVRKVLSPTQVLVDPKRD